MDIILGKLTTGEMVIGKKDDNGIKDAIQLRPKMTSQTSIEIAMAPLFPMFSEDFVFIKNEHIICTAVPAEDISKKYLQAVSGIQIATAGELNSLKNKGIKL